MSLAVSTAHGEAHTARSYNVWVGRDLKDHLVPAPKDLLGRLSAR